MDMNDHIKKADYWYGIISTAVSSGMAITEWCSQNGISKGNYYYWHAVLVKEGRLEKPKTSTDAEPVFAEVPESAIRQKKKGSYFAAAACTADMYDSQVILETKSCFIHLGCDFDTDTLRRVMEVVG